MLLIYFFIIFSIYTIILGSLNTTQTLVLKGNNNKSTKFYNVSNTPQKVFKGNFYKPDYPLQLDYNDFSLHLRHDKVGELFLYPQLVLRLLQ